MTVLFGWGPMWECSSVSPYVMKSMIHLEMLEVDYSVQIADLEEAPFKKAPYVKDEGKLIGDSVLIRRHFEAKLNKDLDAALSQKEKAQAWAIERMVEADMGLMLLHERWLKEENFNKGPMHFFDGVPEAVRSSVIEGSLNALRQRADGQGLSRFEETDRLYLFDKVVSALSNQLGDSTYMFGENATGVDACVAAFVQGCSTPFFETPMIDIMHKYSNLQEHSKRVDARFVKTEKWAAA